MDLQLALDLVGIDEGLAILAELEGLVDILEIGTPMLYRESLKAVEKVKKRFPRQRVLADMKIIDGGGVESADGFKAGAEFVTVMGVSHDATIVNTIESAKKYQGKIMVDLLRCPNPMRRAVEVLAMGADYAGIHTAVDVQAAGNDPLEELAEAAAEVGGDRLSVAGGINLSNLPEVVKYRPGIIIVGGALSKLSLPDRRVTAEKMKGMLKNA